MRLSLILFLFFFVFSISSHSLKAAAFSLDDFKNALNEFEAEGELEAGVYGPKATNLAKLLNEVWTDEEFMGDSETQKKVLAILKAKFEKIFNEKNLNETFSGASIFFDFLKGYLENSLANKLEGKELLKVTRPLKVGRRDHKRRDIGAKHVDFKHAEISFWEDALPLLFKSSLGLEHKYILKVLKILKHTFMPDNLQEDAIEILHKNGFIKSRESFIAYIQRLKLNTKNHGSRFLNRAILKDFEFESVKDCREVMKNFMFTEKPYDHVIREIAIEEKKLVQTPENFINLFRPLLSRSKDVQVITYQGYGILSGQIWFEGVEYSKMRSLQIKYYFEEYFLKNSPSFKQIGKVFEMMLRFEDPTDVLQMIGWIDWQKYDIGMVSKYKNIAKILTILNASLRWTSEKNSKKIFNISMKFVKILGSEIEKNKGDLDKIIKTIIKLLNEIGGESDINVFSDIKDKKLDDDKSLLSRLEDIFKDNAYAILKQRNEYNESRFVDLMESNIQSYRMIDLKMKEDLLKKAKKKYEDKKKKCQKRQAALKESEDEFLRLKRVCEESSSDFDKATSKAKKVFRAIFNDKLESFNSKFEDVRINMGLKENIEFFSYIERHYEYFFKAFEKDFPKFLKINLSFEAYKRSGPNSVSSTAHFGGRIERSNSGKKECKSCFSTEDGLQLYIHRNSEGNNCCCDLEQCLGCWNKTFSHGQFYLKCLPQIYPKTINNAQFLMILQNLEEVEQNFLLENREKINCFFDFCGGHLEVQEKTLLCSQCKTNYCEDCGEIMHEGVPCHIAKKFFKENNSGEELSERCPNPNCSVICVRIDGCHHVTCSICGTRFNIKEVSRDIKITPSAPPLSESEDDF